MRMNCGKMQFVMDTFFPYTPAYGLLNKNKSNDK